MGKKIDTSSGRVTAYETDHENCTTVVQDNMCTVHPSSSRNKSCQISIAT
jgi:hypothetical protein